MSMRIHTATHDPGDAMSALAVEVVSDPARLIDLYGAEFAEVPTPVLIIEDGGNCEAVVITGDLLDFASLVHRAITEALR